MPPPRCWTTCVNETEFHSRTARWPSLQSIIAAIVGTPNRATDTLFILFAVLLLIAACTVIVESPDGTRVILVPSSPTVTTPAPLDPTPTRETHTDPLPTPALPVYVRNITGSFNINVRSCPSTDCTRLGLVRPGETVELLLGEPTDDWLHVLLEVQGLVPGWVINRVGDDVYWEIVE